MFWVFVSDLTLDLSGVLFQIAESIYKISVRCWDRSMD